MKVSESYKRLAEPYELNSMCKAVLGIVLHLHGHRYCNDMLLGNSEFMSFLNMLWRVQNSGTCVQIVYFLEANVGTFVKIPCLHALSVIRGMHARANIWHFLATSSILWLFTCYEDRIKYANTAVIRALIALLWTGEAGIFVKISYVYQLCQFLRNYPHDKPRRCFDQHCGIPKSNHGITFSPAAWGPMCDF